MKEVGRILRQVRLTHNLSLAEVARRLGYRPRRKGVRRLMVIEATGQVNEDLLLRLLEVLGIDLAEFEELMSRLRQQGE
jgi:transcriptional regulator with XRE-family HTH domain